MSRTKEEELFDLLEEANRREKYRKFYNLFPDSGSFRRELYPKHIEFMAAGAKFPERAFIAANGVGKTLTGNFETVCHATGLYPEWWTGKRFTKPTTGWVCGDSGQTLRDGIQKQLIGSMSEQGTGLIPKECLVDVKSMPGVPGAIGQIFVKHVSGGVSEITFKTYNAGQPAFESAAVDYAHLDEECPRDIYAEVAMRTMRKKGIIYLTFTPDEGLTDTTLYFFDEGDFSGGARDGKYIVIVAWTDVPHITADQRKAWLAAIPLHLRDAKTKGIPYLGSGTIYPVDEEEIVCKPFKIPEYWARCFGLDVGYTHPTAAVWLAWDRDNDVVYVYDEYRRSEAEPRVHASAIKDRGKWIPGVIDPAGMQRSKIDGRQLAVLYHNEGVNLQLDERVNNAQEAGIMEILTRFNAGRLKIFNTCQKLIQERRIYRRDARGLVVKKYDDLLDALRYATMSGLPLAQAEADLYDDNVIPYRQAAGRNPVTGY